MILEQTDATQSSKCLNTKDQITLNTKGKQKINKDWHEEDFGQSSGDVGYNDQHYISESWNKSSIFASTVNNDWVVEVPQECEVSGDLLGTRYNPKGDNISSFASNSLLLETTGTEDLPNILAPAKTTNERRAFTRCITGRSGYPEFEQMDKFADIEKMLIPKILTWKRSSRRASRLARTSPMYSKTRSKIIDRIVNSSIDSTQKSELNTAKLATSSTESNVLQEPEKRTKDSRYSVYLSSGEEIVSFTGNAKNSRLIEYFEAEKYIDFSGCNN